MAASNDDNVDSPPDPEEYLSSFLEVSLDDEQSHSVSVDGLTTSWSEVRA